MNLNPKHYIFILCLILITMISCKDSNQKDDEITKEVYSPIIEYNISNKPLLIFDYHKMPDNLEAMLSIHSAFKLNMVNKVTFFQKNNGYLTKISNDMIF